MLSIECDILTLLHGINSRCGLLNSSAFIWERLSYPMTRIPLVDSKAFFFSAGDEAGLKISSHREGD